MTRSGAIVDAVVVARSGARSPRAAPAGRAPTCSRCRRPRSPRCAAAITGCGRREVGLADLHVDDRAPRRFERARGRLHLHDVERRDLLHAGGGSAADIHRTDERRRCGKVYGSRIPRVGARHARADICHLPVATVGRPARRCLGVQMRGRQGRRRLSGRALRCRTGASQFRHRSAGADRTSRDAPHSGPSRGERRLGTRRKARPRQRAATKPTTAGRASGNSCAAA